MSSLAVCHSQSRSASQSTVSKGGISAAAHEVVLEPALVDDGEVLHHPAEGHVGRRQRLRQLLLAQPGALHLQGVAVVVEEGAQRRGLVRAHGSFGSFHLATLVAVRHDSTPGSELIITAAAMALSSTSPLPEDWFTASRREDARIPPAAAMRRRQREDGHADASPRGCPRAAPPPRCRPPRRRDGRSASAADQLHHHHEAREDDHRQRQPAVLREDGHGRHHRAGDDHQRATRGAPGAARAAPPPPAASARAAPRPRIRR